MTAPHLLCGEHCAGQRDLDTAIARLREYGRPIAGRLVPVVADDALDTALTVLAVRALGGVPLAGDDRMGAQQRERFTDLASTVPAPDTAWAAFTSGSGGAPRIVERTHASWAGSFDAIAAALDLTAADVVYLPAPLVSSMSLFSLAQAADSGGTVLLATGHGVAAGDLARATVLHGTPYALRRVVEAIEQGAPSRLRRALIGGARLDAALRTRAERHGIQTVTYYGAAELSFVALDRGNGLRPLPGVDVRTDSTGRLWTRSPYLATGYLGDTRGPYRREDGWGTVGDAAKIDEEGRIILGPRADGAILTSGATVIPDDVEAALRALDGIADAVVFDFPQTRTGALVASALEPADPHDPPDVTRLREQLRQSLSPAQLPRVWFSTTEFPRTATGKPARHAIRADALGGRMTRLG